MKRLLVVLASLLGLIAATAAAGSAERFWALARAPLPEPAYARWDNAITAAAASAATGLIFAVLLTAQLSRVLLLLLGLFEAAMLATSEYLHHQSDLRADLVPGSGGLLLPMWERVVVPSASVALLAVALIWVAVTRRRVVTFAGFPAATVEPRRPVAGGLLALLLGALVWSAAGLSVVALAAANGQASLDFGGFAISSGHVRFGSVTVLYLVAAASLVVGAGLYTALLSRRLHPSEPIVIGVLFGVATVAALVNTMASARSTIDLPGSPLLAAVLLGVQVTAGAPGALLAVPLIAVGVGRLRADQPSPTSAPTYPVSNDPTIPLY